MKPTKRLALRRDVVSDLSSDELRSLAGANALTPQCLTIEVPCPSNPINQCTVVRVTRFETCIC